MTSPPPSRPAWRAGVPALLLLLAGCHGRPTRAECDAMLDRFVDMTIDDDPALQKLAPDEKPQAREAAKAAKRAQPTYRAREQQCLREVSRDEYECAMKAPTPNEWEACIE